MLRENEKAREVVRILRLQVYRRGNHAGVCRREYRGPLATAGEPHNETNDWAAVRRQRKSKPRFSIGGMVVSGLSFVAVIMMAINGIPGMFAVTLWLGAGIALLIWTFGRPRSWWQGVTAWFGGGFTGYTIGFLPLALPAPGGVWIVAVFFLIGIGLLWLGFRRIKESHLPEETPVEFDE